MRWENFQDYQHLTHFIDGFMGSNFMSVMERVCLSFDEEFFMCGKILLNVKMFAEGVGDESLKR